ncbi:hypothetical protein Pfo_006176 [Paulownia fortunei]|nr:hypothetical protein Pfo_006176 [Paulownia fortunei]
MSLIRGILYFHMGISDKCQQVTFTKIIITIRITLFFPVLNWGGRGQEIALNHLAHELICAPNFIEVPPQILENSDFYPYLGAVGVIDGTLIPAWVPAHHQNAFKSRKAHVSQNILALCDFDLMFTYVYVG